MGGGTGLATHLLAAKAVVVASTARVIEGHASVLGVAEGPGGVLLRAITGLLRQ